MAFGSDLSVSENYDLRITNKVGPGAKIWNTGSKSVSIQWEHEFADTDLLFPTQIKKVHHKPDY